nr:LamG-like jellyroll fold domain-containing protein [uncultured Prevotella sp.]
MLIRFVLALLLALAPGASWAGEHFYDLDHAVHLHPNVNEPYINIYLCFYDTNGKDGFFTHDGGGPAIYVDGHLICNADWELAWPGNGSGNNDGLEDQRGNSGWWGNTYTRTVKGTKYTVRFWDPRKAGGKFYVLLCIDMDNMEVGKTHTVTVRGTWRINSGTTQLESKTFNIGAVNIPSWYSTNFNRTNYNTVEANGTVLSNYGPTTVAAKNPIVVGKGSEALPTKYINPSSLPASKGLGKGTTAWSGMNMTYDDSNEKTYGNRIVHYQHSFDVIPSGQQSARTKCTLWKWDRAYLQDFVKPANITAQSDVWKKQVTITWENFDEHSSFEGTWSVYRYPKGKPEASKVIAQKLSVKTHKYTDDIPDYDTDYVYEVAFIPTGMPDGKRIERLVGSITTQVTRKFTINGLDIDAEKTNDKSITIKWNNQEFKGNENYVFKILRADGDTINWEEIGSVSVSKKSQTQYSYTDSKNLQACHTYFYKVQTTMLENHTFVSENYVMGNLLGESQVTSLTATKGDYNGLVKLSWEVHQVGNSITRYELMRTVKGKNNWATIYKTSGIASSYYYEDNTALPGQYYDYKVRSITSCDEQESYLERGTDGFCRSTGIVSGRIAYGTGTAVDGARVTLVRNNDNASDISQFYSLRTSGSGDGVFLALSSDALNSQFGSSAYSVQMFVRPDDSQTGSAPTLFDLGGKLQLQLGTMDEAKGYPLLLNNSTDATATGLYLPASVFTSLTLSVDANGQASVTIVDAVDTMSVATVPGICKVSFTASEKTGLCLGGSYEPSADRTFSGYIDEMRVFSGRALTKADILKNYNHSLTGTEDGLFAYWPVDEGIYNQTTAYDYSKTSGVANGNHGQLGPSTTTSNTVLPTEHQFGIFGITDAQGNFVIRGVPFNGDGTTYMVVPSKGIHEFSPNYSTRYVSASALVHNGVDFEDVSSFPVSGRVVYAGTNYPVEGAQFTVDGTLCSKDGEVITTNANGEYTISVPIGDHYIKVSKTGHVFNNEGRYPADPNEVGTRLTFNQEVKGLEFVDATLVNFSGKVVGGDIEGNKAVGFGLSKNNIGVTELVLTPTNTVYNLNMLRKTTGGVVSYEVNPETVEVKSATDTIASHAWRGAGSADAKKIIIRTDSKTGEFSALVPPLMYKVEAQKVVATGETVGSSATVDLTNPLEQMSDTLYNSNKEVERLYTYCKKLAVTYHSNPQFNVMQRGNDDGAFGISEYTVADELGSMKVSDIYSTATGKPVYKYGAPLFIEMDSYTFDIDAFEQYVNKDDKQNHVTEKVPLRNLEVIVSNALSSEQSVYAENNPQGGTPGEVGQMVNNTLVLDSVGHATYMWKAGLPNITAPYKRTISMSYDINDRAYMWDPAGDGTNMQEGIILGFLPTGNNFVTEGPTLLQMILRDPPGTASSAQWTTGTVKSKYSYKGNTVVTDNSLELVSHWGNKTSLGSGIGFIVMTDVENKWDAGLGVKISNVSEDGNSWTSTVSTEKVISTSAEPEYVGANGDLFIGSSNNLIYGLARNLTLRRDGSDVTLGVKDAYTTGLQFKTEFAYSANYIENVLIPNLISLRNSKLTYVANVNDFKPSGDSVVYLTTLKPEDIGYGTNNNDKIWGKDAVLSSTGRSYTMKIGDPTKSCSDEIVWYNDQIENWQKWLAVNEEEKVRAYEDRDENTKNHSFDAGSSITYTATNENGKGKQYENNFTGLAHVIGRTGFQIAGVGITATVTTDTGGGIHTSGEETETETSTFSYTLAETGDDDAITVDVYGYGKYSPIFRTRGGQTSGPYEGEAKTKYYRPGTTIMEATMQIEVPKIDVDVATVTDVPAGQAANYTLRMMNESQTSEDVYYKLMMIDETNPDGAKLTIDVQPLTDGRLIKIPAGETVTKALQLTQTNLGILNYENVGIVLASQSQYDNTSTWEQIADTVYVTAHFAPSSSAVDMSLSRTTINTSAGEKLTISFDKFDRKYLNLKAFRIQYQKQGDTDWTLLREYVVDKKDLTANNQMLPEGSTVSYDLDMHSYSDGKYLFRVVSVCTYGTSEIYNTSKEITLVKDMQKPRALGLPTPTNGVLTAGDDISLTFSENILKGELTKDMNFLVTGVLNGAKVDHATALYLADMAEAAKTEADINLSDKSFAFDLWINAKKSGTILSHGSGASKFAAAINDDGTLTVIVGTDKYTSVNAMPLGKWSYLHIDYERTTPGGLLNAAVANDENTVSLFADTPVAEYTGNGPLAVGQNLGAAIHELCLWDEARSIDESLADRSKTKQPSTRHLIGYWKMNEGEGTAIRDYSRSRNMTAAAESWYINNENKAVKLNGTSHVGVMMAECSPLSTDDYAVELWMRAGKQDGEAQIMHSGETGLWLNAAGQLRLTSADNTFEASNAPLTDNAWHHVALNVLRNGNAAVYVDGARTLAISARKVGGIAADSLYVGARRGAVDEATGKHTFDRQLTGQVDELRVWNATMNAELLRTNRKVRLTGKEPGLVAYYPFEKKTLDAYNQTVTNGSDIDLVTGKHTAVSGKNIAYTDEAPALRTKPTEENVDFTFTASDNKIVIELNEDEAAIDGSTLNFTVREVRDENGNYSEPIRWSAFVNRRQLSWSDNVVTLTKKLGESLAFSVKVVNNGGKQQMWEISGMPSWLTADTDNGTTDPLVQDDVTFTIAKSTPIGTYSQTVYLVGGDAIEVPLTLNLTVTGYEPEWMVDKSDYENTMNMIAQLSILGTPSADTADKLAVFVGDECRGVGRPVYSKRYDSYYVLLDIYGNAADEGTNLSFRAYDASTGMVYTQLECSNGDVAFTKDQIAGTYADPVLLNALDYQEQTTSLTKGWNWMALYVQPDDMSMQTVLAPINAEVTMAKSQTGFMESTGSEWYGNEIMMNNSEMYKINLSAPATLKVLGRVADPSSRLITVKQGWNWIAYNATSAMSLDEAFAGMQPEDGDVVKAQSCFAVYDGYEWAGTLSLLEPGQGYMLYSVATADRTFAYPSAGQIDKTVKARARRLPPAGYFEPVDYHKYPDNMSLIARVTFDGNELPGAEIGIYAGDECRSHAYTNDAGLAYVTIPGNAKTTLTFKLLYKGKVYTSTTTLDYESDGIVGSTFNPFVINFDTTTGIGTLTVDADENTEWFTVSGQKLGRKPKAAGIYIRKRYDSEARRTVTETVTITDREIE